MEVFKFLRNDDSLQDELEVEEKEIEEENIKSNTAEFKIKTPSKTAADNPFFMPGDL